MAKFIITTLELAIRDPDRHAVRHLSHLLVDALAHLGAEAVRVAAERTNPELLRESVFDAVDGILEAAVAVCVGRDVPMSMPSFGVRAAR